MRTAYAHDSVTPQEMKEKALTRVLVHLLLAFFLANAANKFFTADLDADAKRYALIFDFAGEAPDQYRILPLLALKALCQWTSFHTAVLIFNFALGFISLELFVPFLRKYPVQTRYTFSVLFSAGFIYTLYTGWRPDTLGLLVLCQVTALVGWKMPQGMPRNVVLTLLLAAMAFSRAEIALLTGVFLALHGRRQWVWLVVWCGMAIGVQFLLSRYLFPSATYQTQKVMLADNLRLYYILRNPATWLLAAVCIIWWRGLSTYVRRTYRKFYYFYLIGISYLLLVLVIGRLNELRLYLPFLPLLMMMLNSESTDDGKKVSPI